MTLVSNTNKTYIFQEGYNVKGCIHNEDCLFTLEKQRDSSIDMCITSPPYWGLRDYKDESQVGLEKTSEEYLLVLHKIFAEVYRVLKPSGSCWVNISDVYRKTSLVGIPERFVIGMQDMGWIRRNTIIWHKPNAMPNSAKNRFTTDFEYLYFFTKSKDYYFMQQLEAYTKPANRWGGDKLVAKETGSSWDADTGQNSYRDRDMRPNKNGRNRRCVWSINTKPLKGEHFAAYPEELITYPILACCPEDGIVYDPFMGSGTTAFVAANHHRKFIGSELNKEYCRIARYRICTMRDRNITEKNGR